MKGGICLALLGLFAAAQAFVLPSTSIARSMPKIVASKASAGTPRASSRAAVVRRQYRPEDEDEEEREYARRRRQMLEEERPLDEDYLRRIGEEGEEMYETGRLDRDKLPPVSYQLQFSIFDDLWPTMSRIWKAVVLLDREGTKRRSAQMTVISVSVMSAGLGLLFLALLPAGFIHRPDPEISKVRPTYQTKTYINPDKVRTPSARVEGRSSPKQ